MFTQIFLSEIISIAENGGQGTHFLISQILKSLTHCAVLDKDPSGLKVLALNKIKSKRSLCFVVENNLTIIMIEIQKELIKEILTDFFLELQPCTGWNIKVPN